MFKKILFIITLLLISIPCIAGNLIMTVQGGAPPAYLFDWNCETTTADYSAGDSTGTLVSSAAINSDVSIEGTNSLDIPTSSDRCEFDWANDNFYLTAGTITFKVQFTSFAAGASVFRCRASASNQLLITTSTTGNNHLRLLHYGDGTSQNVSSAIELSTGVTYLVTAKWDVNVHGSDYLYLQIDSETADTGTTALTSPTESSGTLAFGETQGVSIDFAMDDITIYGTWQ